MKVQRVPGESAQELAKRAKVALRGMGFPLPPTPMHSQEKRPSSPELASTMGVFNDTMEQPAQQTSAMVEALGSKPPAIGGVLSWIASHTGAMPQFKEGPWTFYEESSACFRPKEYLGRGTFGKVLGGVFGPNDQAVAVKLLSRNPLHAESDSDLRNEIKALTDLAHPCILHLFGVVFTMCNVQLFCRRHDTTLLRWMTPLSGWATRPCEAEAKHIIGCILKGVAHMHAAGYVHRDLKPANILMNREPLAAIIGDLGAAHLGEDSPDVVTTLFYRAPETMLGLAYTKPSDVWSLGCIFAEVEQPSFFYQLPELPSNKGKPSEFLFMRWFIRKICPRLPIPTSMGSKLEGLSKQVLKLGHIEAGVVGKRFTSNGHSFPSFMKQLLNFQPSNRAIAEGLLRHPWLQIPG